MHHTNIGFKDAVLEALPSGNFILKDPADLRPLFTIEFHNRKAARNWAHGRGIRVLENETASSAAFPRASA